MRGTPEGLVQQPVSGHSQEQAKSRAQPRLSCAPGGGMGTAQSLQPGPAFWSQPHRLQHLVSASGTWCQHLSFFLFGLTDYKLGPGLLAIISPSVQRDWDSKLTQQPVAFRALIEFGLLSYFHYLTQRITAEPQSQLYKPPQVIFDQPNLWEEL